MGSFDCYCALCSGPLGLRKIKFGSRNPKILAARRRYITVRQRRAAGEDVHEDSFMRLNDDGMSQIWVDGGWLDVKASEHEVREWEKGSNVDLEVNKGVNAEGKELVLPYNLSQGQNGQEQEDAGNKGENGGDAIGDAEMVDLNGEENDDNEDGSAYKNEQDHDEGSQAGDEDEGPWDSQEAETEVVEMNEIPTEHEEEQEEENAGNQDGAEGSDQASQGNDESGDEDDIDYERWSELSDLSDGEVGGDDEETENYTSFDWNDNQHYDPGWLTKEDVKWVDRARALALNRERKPGQNAYISGLGRYNDLFDFNIEKHGSDPRDDQWTPIQVYHSYEIDEADPGFPMHEACAKLFFKRLGLKDQSELNRDLLYQVMAQNSGDLACSLELDYGGIDGPGQFWESHSGEEWVVADPGPVAGIVQYVQSILPSSLFDATTSDSLNLSQKVKHDALEQLPYDVLHNVVAQLDRKSTVNLIKASWHVFQSTYNPTFWRLMIRKHMTFFYELEGMMKIMEVPDTFDWRGMFLWLDKITKAHYGIHGPLMKISNRRRIWNTCGELAQYYFDRLLAGNYTEPSEEEARAIMARAESYHTPIACYPQRPASETKEVTTQFIRSWSEIEYQACDLETYWTDHYGKMIGISVNFGTTERLFGSNEGLKGQGLHIDKGEWITKIFLSVDEGANHCLDANKDIEVASSDMRTLGSSEIKGMDVELTSGKGKQLKHARSELQRALPVLEGMYLVGVTGTIASDGTITSFGLLQAPQPFTQAIPPALYPASMRPLWHTRSAYRIPTQPNPDYIFHFFPTRPSPRISEAPMPHPDIISWQLYLFHRGPEGREDMNAPLSVLHFKNAIIGLKQGHFERNTYPHHIGNSGSVPADIPDFNTCETWDQMILQKRAEERIEKDTRYFDMDRKGGEEITQLKGTKDRRAFRLITNRGRSGDFGRLVSDEEDWDVLDVKDDEVVTGLTMTFGEPAEWSVGMRMWSHFVMTDLGIVTTKRKLYEKWMENALKT